MVTKGIITEIISKYQARVRIPIYNKAEESPTATPNEELSIGPVNTLPGINPNISVGDVVIIAFEQDIYTDPVILGLLYTENSSRGFSDVKAGELSVISEAILPSKTTIGSVKGDQIASLENVKGNIQNQIDLLSDKFTEITELSVYDVKVAGTSVVTDGIANIPYADVSTSGVVSTGAQTFSGQKSFNDVIAFNNNVVFNDLSDGGSVTVEIDSNVTEGTTKWAFKQDSPSGSRTDIYYLPTTSNSDTDGIYDILTTKNISDITNTAYNASTNKVATMTDITNAVPNNSNWVNGSATGSVRTVGSEAESGTYTIGVYAVAEGKLSIASGEGSHSEGYRTIAQRKSQHVFGEYNVADTTGVDGTVRGTYVEIVGKGTSNNNRSNARTLDWSGNETLSGYVMPSSLRFESSDIVDSTASIYEFGGPNATLLQFSQQATVDNGSISLSAVDHFNLPATNPYVDSGVSDYVIITTKNVSDITNTAYSSSSNKVATMTDINNAVTVVTFTPDGTNRNLIVSVQQPSSIQNGNEVSY